MAGIGAQVILQTLLVADVNEQAVEDAHLGILAYRYGQAALNHVLQQSGCLQANGFSPGVGAGDKQYAFVASYGYVERIHLFAVTPQ